MKSRTCSHLRFGAWVVAGSIVTGSFVVSGCEVTREKIEVWKDSINGAPKIRAAVRDTDQTFEIRVLAAEALAELGHFGPLQEDLRALAPADGKKLTAGLVDRLLSRMEGTSKQANTKVQQQAKDALFSMRAVLPKQLQIKTDDRVLSWVLADWRRRRGGDHSGEKIITTIGARAAPLVLAQLDKLDKDPEMVETFGPLAARICNAEQKKRAAAKLIAAAKAQNARNPKTIEVLSLFAFPVTRSYLLSLAQSGQPVEVRHNAMLALARCSRDAGLLPAMAAIAKNPKEQGVLRDAAMGVFDVVDSDKGLEILAEIVAGEDKILRYRAAEAMVTCCKARGLAKLLRSLPSRYTYAKEDVQDYLEKDVRELGGRALAPLREALSSKSWIARVIAVRLLGYLGTKQDIPRLEQLVGDQTRLPGWNATLGSEARLAAQRLKKRLSNG